MRLLFFHCYNPQGLIHRSKSLRFLKLDKVLASDYFQADAISQQVLHLFFTVSEQDSRKC